ncbi:dynein assembly factor 1, partial [Striga asiatica]
MSYMTFIIQTGLSLVTYYGFYVYVPIYRKHIKAMVRFVTYLHDEGISMAEFSFEENLLVRDVLKLWKLTFIDATPESRQRDIKLIRAEIENKDYRKLTKHIATMSLTKRRLQKKVLIAIRIWQVIKRLKPWSADI